jgi:transcriptional regulator with XRE-family HTH domain
MTAELIQFGDHLPKALSGSRPSDLRLLRKALRISEREAADAFCMTLRTYRKWEKPMSRVRSNHRGLYNFAKTFGVSLGWLIAGEGPVLR